METKTTYNPLDPAPVKKSRSSWLVVGVVAAVTAALVFAGGAVATGRFSAPSQEGRGEGFGQRPNFQMQAAKELPTTAPALRGVVTQRNGNTLTVGQRNGGPGSNGSNSTQLTDVIVSDSTTVYHDVTQMDFNGQPPNGTIQQKVEPGSLDQINTNNRVTVWGDQNGNQITAKVLVYSQMSFFRPQQ